MRILRLAFRLALRETIREAGGWFQRAQGWFENLPLPLQVVIFLVLLGALLSLVGAYL